MMFPKPIRSQSGSCAQSREQGPEVLSVLQINFENAFF